MNKYFLEALLLALALASPVAASTRVDIGVSISLPPPIVFVAPPDVVVIPETNVYVVPDLDADIFFFNGWWWRPWEGRWYRSRNYGSGWGHYQSVPSFYGRIPSGWRNDYRERRWQGHPWEHQRIPHQQVQKNWRTWEKDKHWEKQNNWGVQGLKPQKRSAQPPPARPQSREVRSPRPQSPSREIRPAQLPQPRKAAAQQSKPKAGKPGKGGNENREKR